VLLWLPGEMRNQLLALASWRGMLDRGGYATEVGLAGRACSLPASHVDVSSKGYE